MPDHEVVLQEVVNKRGGGGGKLGKSEITHEREIKKDEESRICGRSTSWGVQNERRK